MRILSSDTISGGDGNDILAGQQGVDIIKGDAGDDLLFGGKNKDYMDGGLGSNKLTHGNTKKPAKTLAAQLSATIFYSLQTLTEQFLSDLAKNKGEQPDNGLFYILLL